MLESHEVGVFFKEVIMQDDWVEIQLHFHYLPRQETKNRELTFQGILCMSQLHTKQV